MEEFVGRVWHKLITRAAGTEFDAARVSLDDMRRAIEMLFRAGGGSPLLRLREAADQARGGPRGWLQRVAGTGTEAALPQLDADSLALPATLAVFEHRALNRELYLWLAAQAAFHHSTNGWLADNLSATRAALLAFPGLRERYRRLCAAHLALRPDPDSLKGDAAQAERTVRAALCSPDDATLIAPDAALLPTDVAPVWLWLNPSPAERGTSPRRTPDDTSIAADARASQRDTKRRHATEVDDPQNRAGMMMFFRTESLLSWSEYVRVNRETDDDDDGLALTAANDMQTLAIAPDGKTSAARVKFDLDLPSAAQDDVPVATGIRLPEWNWKKQTLEPDRCSAQLLVVRSAAPYVPAPELHGTARRVRRQLEALRALPRRSHGEISGDELDIDAWVRHITSERAAPQRTAEAPVFSRLHDTERSLACLLLADLSLSTSSWANNDAQIIDVIRDALYVFGEALTGLGDPFAMLGFSSVRRSNIRMHLLKGFNEPWNDTVRARVGAIKPGYYTRMGAALRFATREMKLRPERQRLVLLLTDGKPNDLDVYEGRWGLEDTRAAVLEARAAGLLPYCVTIDQEGHDYLPHLFGPRGYAVVNHPTDLVNRLSTVYVNLATSK